MEAPPHVADRAPYFEIAERDIARATRKSRALCLFFMDLDDCQAINAQFGFAEARRCSAPLRNTTVSPMRLRGINDAPEFYVNVETHYTTTTVETEHQTNDLNLFYIGRHIRIFTPP